MKKTIALIAMLVFFAAGAAYAMYDVSNTGNWPKSWPRQLEPLRKQSQTYSGPMVLNLHYAIGFKNRKEFEATWKHILKVKTKGTPIFLVSSPNFFLGDKVKAGVVIHCPPANQVNDPNVSEIPISAVQDERSRWMNANFIELVVDGDVINLNRIKLPTNTPIVDERFKDEARK